MAVQAAQAAAVIDDHVQAVAGRGHDRRWRCPGASPSPASRVPRRGRCPSASAPRDMRGRSVRTRSCVHPNPCDIHEWVERFHEGRGRRVTADRAARKRGATAESEQQSAPVMTASARITAQSDGARRGVPASAPCAPSAAHAGPRCARRSRRAWPRAAFPGTLRTIQRIASANRLSAMPLPVPNPTAIGDAQDDQLDGLHEDRDHEEAQPRRRIPPRVRQHRAQRGERSEHDEDVEHRRADDVREDEDHHRHDNSDGEDRVEQVLRPLDDRDRRMRSSNPTREACRWSADRRVTAPRHRWRC